MSSLAAKRLGLLSSERAEIEAIEAMSKGPEGKVVKEGG